MGSYHIKLCPFSRTLCAILLPWNKYKYQKLPMGLCNSPDIFQGKMNDLFNGLDYVRTYSRKRNHFLQINFNMNYILH